MPDLLSLLGPLVIKYLLPLVLAFAVICFTASLLFRLLPSPGDGQNQVGGKRYAIFYDVVRRASIAAPVKLPGGGNGNSAAAGR